MNIIVDSSLSKICEYLNASECFAFFMHIDPILRVKKDSQYSFPISNIICSQEGVKSRVSKKHFFDSKFLKLNSQDEIDFNDISISISNAYSSMCEIVLSIDLRFTLSKKIIVRYIFFSTNNSHEKLLFNKSLLNAKLLNTSLQLNGKHKLIANILLDSGGVNPKLLNIINFVADGISREDIAEKMSLSVRGVDYHIELAKQVFNAKNMPELIYLASQHGLLNGDFYLEVNNEN